MATKKRLMAWVYADNKSDTEEMKETAQDFYDGLVGAFEKEGW